MRPEMVGPDTLEGASGARDCASELRHGSGYSISTPNLDQDLRLARLRARHGLSAARASLIASLAYDDGRR